ncbi:hypothetical protein AAFC00_005586 [Neodothiora populina]|uniref:Sas10 C-terminal domain-containing protein n=1 Tax=Neodothiora populina TaxID=2781224 RepID=A0ABR3PLE5_9PEZI
MAKKRKANAASTAQEAVPDSSNKRTRLRIDTYEDVAGSDDEFHISRDKVLLDDGPAAKKQKAWQDNDEFLEQSEEEVLGYSDASEDEEEVDQQDDDEYDDDTERKHADEEEEAEGWGASKQDYYNADAIETEQDALDEEAEALRIQKKQLAAMSEADYGFDESEWQTGGAEGMDEDDQDGDQAVVTEVLPQLEVSDSMGPAERVKALKARYPEFEPLSKELLKLQARHKELTTTSSATSPVTIAKRQAATAYLASLTMYFALLTSTADDSATSGLALSATTLRDHPVMDSLVQCQQLWENVKDLPEDITSGESASDMSEAESEEDEGIDMSAIDNAKNNTRKTKKSRAQKAAEAVQKEAAARRAERMAKAEADLADLDALTKAPSRRATKIATQSEPRVLDDEDSDFGEDSELTEQQLAEKAKRKKSLRFYTSQIAQKANKRGAAGRNAGGDDDIPYRERLRDRQARLNAEAEKRGKNNERDVLGDDSDEEDRRQAKELRAAANSDEEYYDMVAAKSARKKADKKAASEAYKEAAQQGGRVVEKLELGPDGKRAITYAIEKNKGLTPHRKKDVRNPRVKKRKKYDEKKKKLASMRPVYKGGEGRGGYGGELTGIKKGLVKSTKL